MLLLSKQHVEQHKQGAVMAGANWFNRLLVLAMPLVPRPIVKAISSNYVAGETTAEMLTTVRKLQQEGATCTVDLLGEFITDISQAHETARRYHEILDELYQAGLTDNSIRSGRQATISVKLTALGLLLDEATCFDLIRGLVAKAAETDNFVRLDMEDTPCTDATIHIYLKLRQEFENVGIVLQAYLRRTLGDTRYLCGERAGNIRLCKGIYVEPRNLAYKDGSIINKNYTLVLEELFSHKQQPFVGIATHDERLVWEACRLLDKYQIPKEQYEFQMLLGVDPQMRTLLINSGHPLRVYVPFGRQWYQYSIRRLKENPTIAGYVFNAMIKRILRYLNPKIDNATDDELAKGVPRAISAAAFTPNTPPHKPS